MGVGDIPNFNALERGKAVYGARFHSKIQPVGVEIFEKNHKLDLAH